MFSLLCALLVTVVYVLIGALIDLVCQGQLPTVIPLLENSSGMEGILAGLAMMPEVIVLLAIFGTTTPDESSTEEGLLLDQFLFRIVGTSKTTLILSSLILAALLSSFVYLVWSTLSISKELDTRNCVCLAITFVAVISVFVITTEGSKKLDEA